MGPRFSARRAEPDEDREGAERDPAVHEWRKRVYRRRSGAASLPDRVSLGAGILDGVGCGGGGSAYIPAEGRIPDLRRFLWRALVQLRDADAESASECAHRSAGAIAPHLRLVLSHYIPRLSASLLRAGR